MQCCKDPGGGFVKWCTEKKGKSSDMTLISIIYIIYIDGINLYKCRIIYVFTLDIYLPY